MKINAASRIRNEVSCIAFGMAEAELRSSWTSSSYIISKSSWIEIERWPSESAERREIAWSGTSERNLQVGVAFPPAPVCRCVNMLRYSNCIKECRLYNTDGPNNILFYAPYKNSERIFHKNLYPLWNITEYEQNKTGFVESPIRSRMVSLIVWIYTFPSFFIIFSCIQRIHVSISRIFVLRGEKYVTAKYPGCKFLSLAREATPLGAQNRKKWREERILLPLQHFYLRLTFSLVKIPKRKRSWRRWFHGHCTRQSQSTHEENYSDWKLFT